MDRFASLSEMKRRREPIAVLTAYDYPTARVLDEAGVDVILVGDTVGMVVLGFPDTTHVTMEHMLHHAAAVRRAVQRAPVVVDLPIGTYSNVDDAVANARRLAAAGADAVKLEGGISHCLQAKAIIEAGIPVMGHIGMLPQSVQIEGGYKIKGKTHDEAALLLADALALESVGVIGMVLELIRPDVSARITQAVRSPTIGIGSGPACDGQILVTHDLVGLYPWFVPKFVKPRARFAEEIREVAIAFIRETKAANIE